MIRACIRASGVLGPRAALALSAAVLLLAPLGTAAAYELHLNCAGVNYTTQDGTFFAADRPYTSGDAGFIDGNNCCYSNWEVIGGTPDFELYRWVRFNLTEYRFDLPNGNYLVTLHLVDIFRHSTGENQFDVLMEGQERLSDVDIYALVQRNYAIDFVVPVAVADGQLNVVFHRDIGFASISGISVVSRDPDAIAPAPPTGVTAANNYLAVAINWADGPEDDLAGYQVERSASAGGPFSPVGLPLEQVSRRLDPATAGQTWHYRVRAVDAFNNTSNPSAVVSGTSLLNSSTSLPIAEVLIAPNWLEVLNDAPSSDTYVECDAVFDGILFPDAMCRYRGNVSRSLRKKSWKVKFQTSLFAGRDNFNINAEYVDKSLMRTRLCYELMERNSVDSPRARSVHMMVNGQWAGVYSDVENVDGQFLERVGLDALNSNLYKPWSSGDSTNLIMLPNVQEYMTRYEKELGDPSDYSDLIDFIERINLTSADSLFHYLAGHVDLNRMIDFYATASVLQHWDISSKNWFLHHNLTTDRWTVIPFDVDMTFGPTWPFATSITTQWPIFVASGNRLFRHVEYVPQLSQLFLDRTRQILTTTFTASGMDARIDSVYAEIQTDAERDWWKWGWEDNTWFHDQPNELNTFVSGRIAFLNNQIPLFDDPPDLVINEIQASNSTTVADEWGDHDDWIELYNRGTSPISLLGLYLTDTLTLPGRFALPDTTLLPGQRAIVWADNEPTEGHWHAPFKLEEGGEEVGIFTGTLATSPPIDVKMFDPQFTDASYGRLPDGSPYWQVLYTPTPGTANVGGGNLRPQVTQVAHFPGAPPANSPVRITARIYDDGTLTATQVLYDAGAGWVTQGLSDNGQNGDGAAGDGLYGALLPGQPAQTTVLYYVRAQDNLGAVTTHPTGAPATTHTYTTGYVPPFLKLNELMASNLTTVDDEQGDFDDWVELWNAGNDTLSLGGMFLTDDFLNPNKWMFPEVSMAPNDFLLVWCDEEPAEGPLHTNFKLAAPGEELGLFDTQVAGVGLIDTVSFGQQTTDVSFGRLPDGGPWRVLETPSPGETNGPVGIGETGAPPRVLALRGPFPNPFNPSAVFELDLPAAGPVRLRIHDVHGRRVRGLIDEPLPAGNHRATWDGRDDRGHRVASGVYWFRLEAGGEHRQTRAVLLR